jgi:DNA modification methylase
MGLVDVFCVLLSSFMNIYARKVTRIWVRSSKKAKFTFPAEFSTKAWGTGDAARPENSEESYRLFIRETQSFKGGKPSQHKNTDLSSKKLLSQMPTEFPVQLIANSIELLTCFDVFLHDNLSRE